MRKIKNSEVKPAEPYDSGNWGEISRLTREIVGGYCCYPGCWKRWQPGEAISGWGTHHVLYQDLAGLIKGREIPGKHVYWLCPEHHSNRKNPQCAHYWRNWIKSRKRNTTSYYQLLLIGWEEKVQFVRCRSP